MIKQEYIYQPHGNALNSSDKKKKKRTQIIPKSAKEETNGRTPIYIQMHAHVSN